MNCRRQWNSSTAVVGDGHIAGSNTTTSVIVASSWEWSRMHRHDVHDAALLPYLSRRGGVFTVIAVMLWEASLFGVMLVGA